jgi:hypothetical protein
VHLPFPKIWLKGRISLLKFIFLIKIRSNSMAMFHLEVKSCKRGTAASHAAYITRQGKYGKGEGRGDLVAKGYGNLPGFANGDPIQFWKAADRYERTNGAASREYVVALPRELSLDVNEALVKEFIRRKIGDKPYQYVIHNPLGSMSGSEHPHAHINFSDRRPDGIERSAERYFCRANPKDPEKGGCRKDSGGKAPLTLRNELVATRKAWADAGNDALERHGYPRSLDYRSHKERGLEREPEQYLGQARVRNMTPEDIEAFRAGRLGRISDAAQTT